MKKIFTSIGIICSTFVFGQKASIATWKNDTKAAYTIIHDDYGDPIVDGIWQYADTIAANRGIKFTIGAITNLCEAPRKIQGYNTPYDYAKQVMMDKHGHEIISHSHTHSCAVGNTNWSPCDVPGWAEKEDFHEEIVQCTQSIQTGTGHKPQFYIFPYDRFTNAANNKLKELGYIGSRTGFDSSIGEEHYKSGYNANDSHDFYPDSNGFFRTSLQVFDDIMSQEGNHHVVLNTKIDEAILNNQWINRELHNVGTIGWGHVSVESYRKHIDYLQAKVKSGELWVGTVSEILTYQIQKLKYTPQLSQTADFTWEVAWVSINPQIDIVPTNYLKELGYKTPITLKVDLEGKTGTWEVTQNGTPVSFEIKKGILYTNIYPHQGGIKLNLVEPTYPPPFVENPIADQKLPIDFTTYTINLKNVFADENTPDDKLIYTVSGNTNIKITIDNGIATISATTDWNGTEMITFSVEDESGKSVNDVVTFVVDGKNEPFTGTPISIFGKIEAENYDKGGQGVSYNEIDTYEINVDNYRTDAVDIKHPSSYSVLMEKGEWLEYTIDVTTDGYYNFDIAAICDTTNVSAILSIDETKELKQFPIVKTTEANKFQSNKLYDIALTKGKHVLRVYATGKFEFDYINIEVTGENTNPVLTSPIPNQNLFVDFTPYKIDLKEFFDDIETTDKELVYTVKGNTNIKVDIIDGIANLSSTKEWNGIEDVIFTATDFKGLSISDTVTFSVTIISSPNKTVNNGEGYIFTFDETETLNCINTMIPHANTENKQNGYKLESVGGGNLVISTNGNQYGTDNFTLGFNDACTPSLLNLSHPNKRVIEVRIHSTIDVKQFLPIIGDTAKVMADYDVATQPLKANEWQTLTFTFNSMKTWSGKTMEPTQLNTISLMFRNNYNPQKQGVAGTFTIDYIKIGGAIDSCPQPIVLKQPMVNALDEGNDAQFEIEAYGNKISYQWYRGSIPLQNGDKISGVTTTNFSVKNIAPSDTGVYYCKISDECGSSIHTINTKIVYANSNRPFTGTPITIPGLFQAEDYDRGGAEVAYHEINGEWDPENPYRDDDVDLEKLPDSDNNYSVSYTKKGEWLKYTVDVSKDGDYQFDIHVASPSGKKGAMISVDGDSITTIPIKNSGSWTIFKTSSGYVPLTKGKHVIRLYFPNGFNIDYFNTKDVTGFPKKFPIDDIELTPELPIVNINLYDAFEDKETSDEKLAYTFTGNPELKVTINNGIATITANGDFVGTEDLIFTAKDTDGNSTDLPVTIKVKKALPIIEQEASTFMILPNPASSTILINTDDVETEIELYDLKGIKLPMKKITNNQFDISELPAGWYILKQGYHIVKLIKE